MEAETRKIGDGLFFVVFLFSALASRVYRERNWSDGDFCERCGGVDVELAGWDVQCGTGRML